MPILDKEEQAKVSAQAANFANVTQVAYQFAELMGQSFDIRIKSGLSAKQFSLLACCYIGSKKSLALLLGNTLKVKVNWTNLDSNIFLKDAVTGETLFLFEPDEVDEYVTNIGLASKMRDMWVLVSNKSQ